MMSQPAYLDEKREPSEVNVVLDPEGSSSLETFTALVAEGERSISLVC
jgi:hypothetical protein